jgi:integrase
LGWEVALTKFRPDAKPRCITSIGGYIETVGGLLNVRGRSLANYAYALRKIALEATAKRESSASRFDPKTLTWRRKVDDLPLASLTPQAVELWKASFIRRAGDNHLLQQRARRSVNSYIRNARALFSKRVLRRLKDLHIPLPSPLPFEGVELERQGSSRYVSTMNAADLLALGKKELAGPDPDAWKVILLALGAGLRRSEIDGLCWTQIDFKDGAIRIVNSAHFEAKTDDSEGAVFVDAGLLAELKKMRKVESGLLVVDPELEPRANRAVQYYRCLKTFERVTRWLRQNGVLSDKPLHALRKEFGSIIAGKADIHTASRQLRHANIGTTAAYYADHRRRETVNVGDMLGEAK